MKNSLQKYETRSPRALVAISIIFGSLSLSAKAAPTPKKKSPVISRTCTTMASDFLDCNPQSAGVHIPNGYSSSYICAAQGAQLQCQIDGFSICQIIGSQNNGMVQGPPPTYQPVCSVTVYVREI